MSGERAGREGDKEREKERNGGKREGRGLDTPRIFVDCAANSSPVNDLITFVT